VSGDRRVIKSAKASPRALVETFYQDGWDDWTWFENVLSYDNAKLAHALS
jgi:hypothetical protein